MPTLEELLAAPLIAPANDNTDSTDTRLPTEPYVRTPDATDQHRHGARRPAAQPRARTARGAFQHRALRPRRRT